MLFRSGATRGRTGSVLPGVAPSNAYPTADGFDVLIAANADQVFARLGAAMGQPGLAADERFSHHEARGRNSEVLDEQISAWTASLSGDEVLEVLERHGVPAGRIYTAADMIADPHYAAREMVVRISNAAGAAAPFAGVVPKLSRTPGAVERGGPVLGADTRAVLGELAGVGDEEWIELERAGVVGR